MNSGSVNLNQYTYKTVYMEKESNRASCHKRIGSIDALRAFALFGILLVHSISQFCCGPLDTVQTTLDSYVEKTVFTLFSERSHLIFMILFGVSFYLILRNPAYSSRKFVWRCILLTILGIIAKIFYWPDVLMWYGVFGIVLVTIRNFTNKQIVLTIVITYIITELVCQINLGNWLNSYISHNLSMRYDEQTSLKEAITLLPDGLIWHIRNTFNSGIFFTLLNFMIGYLIARLGFIEIMDEKAKFRHVVIMLACYLVFSILYKYAQNPIWMSLSRFLMIYSCALLYCIFLIWLYNHTCLRSFLQLFEPYGRCGLTNYTMQGVVGVLAFCHYGLAFKHYRLTYIIMGVLLFFLIQAFFSYVWLHYFRNGPMEYLWRCATDRKWLPLLKK